MARDRGWMYSLVTADGGDVYWSEARPLEGGRDAIVVRRAGGEPVDAIPARFSARTRVHEYGGGAFTVARRRRCTSATTPTSASYRRRAEPITPEPDAPFGLRYADLRVAGELARLRARARRRARARQRARRLPLDGSSRAAS